MLDERYDLVVERIKEIVLEDRVSETYLDYFKKVGAYILRLLSLQEKVNTRGYFETNTPEELNADNMLAYKEQLPDNYDESYLNPTYASDKMGNQLGGLLCFLFTELQGMIPFVFERNREELLIRMELFAEVYTEFCYAYEELKSEPKPETVKDILYWYVSDYVEPSYERRIREQLDPSYNFFTKSIMRDLTDLRYLYVFGEYVSKNEIETARFLNGLSEAQITKIAQTVTEGFRKGFELAGKDLTCKETVNIRYCLGFERVIKAVVEEFQKLSLQPVIYRAGHTIFDKSRGGKVGCYGGICNQQYEYDHKQDDALFLDGHLITRRLECLREAYRSNKELASALAGPACIEVFGEVPFAPVLNEKAPRYTEEQQKLIMDFTEQSGRIVNEYIRRDERSFTIIAFPTYAIGPDFEGIFNETVKINTLDYHKYAQIQQTIIDVLNTGDSVHVVGANGNRTNITVMLCKLNKPETQTKFENCVADVNIPVGEVFTSPMLKGTNGTLHVTGVYLNDLEYKQLELEFKDGVVSDYNCINFSEKEECKKFIRENLLNHYETLPLGEFAIGTNTVAYKMAEKYQIADKLPILIAEKMGPHFAIGDTCYSQEEDVKVFNPDGKEIVAKENEISALRSSQPEKAYFRCHTDITIPYHELGLLEVNVHDGSTIPIIKDGRFVLAGCEELNLPLDE